MTEQRTDEELKGTDMEDRLTLSNKFKILTYALIGVGVVSFALGFVFDAERTWANYLLNNYYFVSLAIGAAFFCRHPEHYTIGLVGHV